MVKTASFLEAVFFIALCRNSSKETNRIFAAQIYLKFS